MTLSLFPILLVVLPLLELGVIFRILLRPHRDPASRIAWLLVVTAIPVIGVVIYLLFGEVRVSSRNNALFQSTNAETASDWPASIEALIPERHRNLFRLGYSINGFPPVGGNTASLLEDSNSAIDAIVADIDAAKAHVHIDFYIWLPDNNGRKIIEALKRAAARGVTCRALADDLGSRTLIRSEHWTAMRKAGVQLANALPIGNPLVRLITGRVDVRNHRKIVVIDGTITYCGSQNCADPEFLPKAKYAPWVDAMVRFKGPVVNQNQLLFASDWMSSTGNDLAPLLRGPPPISSTTSMPAQVIGTGPTARYSAMSEVFESLFFAARRDIVVTTPYYVPDEALQKALCTCANRGVVTTLIVPAKNDSWIVAAASRSYYADLLASGVNIHEYVGGLLHTKSVTMDGEITLVGSANLDRRSFELNFENNILVFDADLTAAVRQRQLDYLAKSISITEEMVSEWPMSRRLWHNAVATVGPLL